MLFEVIFEFLFFFAKIPWLRHREISKKGGILLKPSRQCPLDVCVHCKAISHLAVESKLFWFSSVLVPCWVVDTDGKNKLCTFESVVLSQILFVAVFCGLVWLLISLGMLYRWRRVVLKEWILHWFLKITSNGNSNIHLFLCVVSRSQRMVSSGEQHDLEKKL